LGVHIVQSHWRTRCRPLYPSVYNEQVASLPRATSLNTRILSPPPARGKPGHVDAESHHVLSARSSRPVARRPRRRPDARRQGYTIETDRDWSEEPRIGRDRP